jgi:uncharacterized caspase-like protein
VIGRSLIALAALLVAVEAEATVRFALIAGVNHGRSDDPELRYAERDAERIAEVLTSVGDFHPENVILLKNATATDLERAIATSLKRIAGTAEDTLFFVYYSGHADGEALNMRGTRFELETLRDRILSSTAKARVLVLDACHAGVLTRVKGGTPSPEFAVDLAPDPSAAEGFAILASSAAGEEAQESDALQASFFTHYFASALIGAADHDSDRRVTLAEAFAFASDRTLRATMPTVAGPQHPTYKIELKGRDDLVLSDLRRDGSKSAGMLELEGPGRYLIASLDGASRAVAEVELADGEARPLVLGAGRYSITRRGESHLLVGELTIENGSSKRIGAEEMQRVEFARVVRKGGTDLSAVPSAFVLGGARTALRDGGTAWSTAAGLRFDLSELAIEARAAGSLASRENDRLEINTRELALSAAALRAFDLGAVTASLGVEAGGTYLAQRYGEPASSHHTFGVIAGPIGALELVFGRVYGRIEAAMPTYLVRAREAENDRRFSASITFRGGIGLGLYL